MASVLDVVTPEEKCERLEGLVRALVHHAGGEVSLTFHDFHAPRDFQLEWFAAGSNGTHVLLRCRPETHRDGAFYWVKMGPDRDWEPAQHDDGRWHITGIGAPVEPHEIGDLIGRVQ